MENTNDDVYHSTKILIDLELAKDKIRAESELLSVESDYLHELAERLENILEDYQDDPTPLGPALTQIWKDSAQRYRELGCRAAISREKAEKASGERDELPVTTEWPEILSDSSSF